MRDIGRLGRFVICQACAPMPNTRMQPAVQGADGPEQLVSQCVYKPLDAVYPGALARALRGILISREFSEQFLLALAQVDRGFDDDFAI